MAVQVASLFGVLSLDDKDFQRGMKNADSGFKSAQNKMKSFGDGVRNTGLVIMGAATPFLAFAATAVQAAGESQQAVAQLDAVIKSTGGSAGVTSEHAQQLASALQNVTMYGDETVLSAENMLLTFTNIGAAGGVFDSATRTALDMSQALGQDVTSSAIQLGKALNDPINGITALTRVGVTFTDAQKAQIEAMVKSGDVAGAQKLILQELQREFGGSAVAAGQTFPGQLAILNNKFGEVQEKIGSALIPALMSIVANVAPIIDKIASWIEQNPELVKNIALATVVVFALGGAMTILGTAVGFVSGAFTVLFSPVVLLVAAIGGLLWLINEKYPGGIKKCLEDAARSAQMLATLGFGALTVASEWARARLAELLNTILSIIGKIDELKNRLAAGLTGGAGIIQGLTSGQFSIQQVLNAISAEVAPRAGGGSVMGNTSYLVGEQGPELFTPSTSGNISTAGETAKAMAGDTYNLTIYANDYAGGQAAHRGFMDAARAKGY